jgi:glucose-6-phosphate isomerase
VDITTTPAWSAALKNAATISQTTLKDLFARNSARAESLSIEVLVGRDAMFIDFSKQNVDDHAVQSLIAVAEQAGVEQKRNDMFEGVVVNGTEHQPALHTALRAPEETSVNVNGVDVMEEVLRVRAQVNEFAESVRAGRITGATGKKFQSVINVGIGGSDLGPTLVYEALSSSSTPAVQVHFVSNIDPAEVRSVLRECNPETTLVVLCSKSFSTAETLSNGRIIADWISDSVGATNVSKHLAVVSVFPEKAASMGLAADYIFPMWSWVGGRYSISSAVNLVNVIAFGSSAYNDMLSGMRSMDEHFMTAPLQRNAPVLMGVLNVWNRSMLGRETRAMIAYASALKSFASYVQQLEMESNGKRVTADGNPVSLPTSPIVWGGVGTNAQHAYMQLLHQGTSVVPADFIGVAATPTHDDEVHDALVANLFAQTQALAFGNETDPHRTLPGNRPSTTIMLSSLSPRTLGALIALYEHSVFVQGCVFGVNSFDQWGVELGKKLANEVSAQITAPSQSGGTDASTAKLVQWYKTHRSNT